MEPSILQPWTRGPTRLALHLQCTGEFVTYSSCFSSIFAFYIGEGGAGGVWHKASVLGCLSLGRGGGGGENAAPPRRHGNIVPVPLTPGLLDHYLAQPGT